MLLAAYAGVNVTVSINESWTTSTKIQFSLIEQHYAVLAKTNISDHHRQILQQQMHSLLHDPIDSCRQFTFSRVLLTIDATKSEST